ncbi:glycoside hydrolase family 30 protein [Paenibacillus sp. UASWS1643]|uniref:glycoside hydrolase family 30 protein n=1 Tax=Paenibacillus sp. UASWS1643 TaxID=2580422 RepID=UPI0012389C34|nr:glycoside hydrolase family 30 beta sandwich domain-containing protein [Paenibacillus sp. UASWS1643]KAA8747747.1 beta-1,6-glucanase [Paenibacillus sp. UASWS1643]
MNIGWREHPKRWMILLIAAVCFVGIGIWLIFNRSEQPAPPPVVDKQRTAEVWITTGDQQNLLTPQKPIPITDHHDADTSSSDSTTQESAISSSAFTIRIDPDKTYQTMDGFGAAMTGSSAHLINQLQDEKQEQMLKELFTTEGLNLDMVRHTIGASDYSVDELGKASSYTYDDIESGTDYEMEHFSIEKDQEVVNMLKRVADLKPDLKVLGTPWTAPAWMKYGEKTTNGWYLDYNDPQVYEAYARYFVKYIIAYQAKGIPIYGITLQNEPEFTSDKYPSMSMGPEEQAMFIRDYLGPALQDAGLDTRIIAYDHNWDQAVEYTSKVLGDEQAAAYIDASAFHCYAGDPSAMSEVHERFPDKNIYFTECSGGEWSPDFGENLSWQMSNLIIGAPRNWAKNVLLWNIALDPQGGPTNGGCENCRGVVTIDPENNEINRNVEYYALGHISRYVRPGAVRVDSTQEQGQIENVTFRNPDGTMVLVAANTGEAEVSFDVVMDGDSFRYILPSQSAATFRWKPKTGVER